MSADISSKRRQEYEDAGWWRRDRTFLDDFLEGAAKLDDKPAVIGHIRATGLASRHDFGELKTLVDRCAVRLLDLGVNRGEVVSFQLPNWWQFTVLSMACFRVGAVANPIPTILREREVSHILDQTRARVFVVPGVIRGFDYATMARVLADDLPCLTRVFVLGESFEQFFTDREVDLNASQGALERRRPLPNDVAEVQFTSGTTGRPKGVVHTYNTIWASYRGITSQLALADDDVIFVPSTMAHQTGFLNGCVMPLAEGMTVVYQDQWDPGVALELIIREGVTYASGAAPFLIDLCEASERSEAHLEALRYFRCGGSALHSSVIERAERALGTQVVVSWGMTENGVCTISRRDSPAADVASSEGFPLPWVRFKITDLGTGESRPTGSEGLLWVQSASQCLAYLGEPQAYSDAFDDTGWFNTGDVARLNHDGSMRMIGRHKDLVVRGGENIPVAEVESALAEHSAVHEVAVVGVPDDRLGERACAVVVPASTLKVDLDLIRQHLASIGMAKQFWPEYVLEVSDLPRTAAGKVRKGEVRDYAVSIIMGDTSRTRTV